MHEHAAIAGLRGEAIFDFQPVVRKIVVRDEMPAGRTETDQQSISHHKRNPHAWIVVALRHIGVPAGEILAVEQRFARRHTTRRVTIDRSVGRCAAANPRERKRCMTSEHDTNPNQPLHRYVSCCCLGACVSISDEGRS